MLVAVIDAGTNTFTMNIYRLLGDERFEKFPKERYYVNLAENGIDQLGKGAQNRAMTAFEAFRKLIDELNVSKVFAFGTAALRRASNGKQLIKDIYQQTAIQIELIDGEREAELIYQGVKHAAPLDEQTALIIDIGGGSVEFILCNKAERFWARSFPIGVAHLYNEIIKSDPISAQEVLDLENYLNEQLEPLKKALKSFPPKVLIGASGTFDALESMIGTHQRSENYGYIALDRLSQLSKELQQLSYSERKAYPKLPESRAKLIVVAMIMVDDLLKLASIEKDLIISDYALREGVMFELMRT